MKPLDCPQYYNRYCHESCNDPYCNWDHIQERFQVQYKNSPPDQYNRHSKNR